MNGGMDAAGDIATGALLGRTVEPRAGDHATGAGHGLCLNCGTALVGEYCHRCGQSGHVHRTLVSILHDLLHGAFHFEGKIWRTLPMLAFHPGALTRRYITGERARFVSPTALFLFSVFAMFAVYNAVGPRDLGSMIAKGFDNTRVAIGEARHESIEKLGQLEKARAAAVAAHMPIQELDKQIAQRRHALAALDTERQRFDGNTIYTTVPWIDHALNAARENPQLVVYKVQSAAYKYSWMLIVLSTPFVALLFLWKRGYRMYDHAVFVTYSITFMSLLTILAVLGGMTGIFSGVLGVFLLVAPAAHMFVQLRGAYRLSVFSALWRTAALMVFASIALSLFVSGIIAMEVSG